MRRFSANSCLPCYALNNPNNFFISLDPLRVYTEDTITLELPGDLTIFDIDWFSVYDIASKQNLGSVIVPDDPNVPPSLGKIIVNIYTITNFTFYSVI